MGNSSVKQKSTILKDALALFLITVISGLALSYIYETTKAPIAAQQEQKKQEAYQAVYADADSFEVDGALEEMAATADMEAMDASYKGVTIDAVNIAKDGSNNPIGYIVQVTTKESYKESISLTFGFSKDGAVQGLEFLSISETAGLGMNATKPEFKDQFADKAVAQFEVTKTGATEDHQIDALSSATITSKAIVNAVNAGIGFLNEFADIGGGANE